MSAELMWKDVTEQAALVRSGEVSARELVDAAIARLEGASELNVLVNDQFEAARAAAAAPPGDGVLAGVPFLLKDLGEPQAGIPEYLGSRALRDHVASETAWTVERYLTAGIIICGRTSTAEFGNHCATEPSLFGRALNPWRAELSPGGSSGGSAAAVAAGLIGAASGSDGTGSIRMPSSCCGLVGLKPRRGRSSFAPSAGQALDGLAVKHALTRTVRDTALLLDVITGTAPGDPYSAPSPQRPFVEEVGADPGRLRILRLERPPFPGTPEPRIQEVADLAARTLEGLGHAVESGVMAFDAEAMRRAISVIHAVDNAATFRWLEAELGRRPEPDELDPVTWDMLNEGLELSALDHLAAVDQMHAQSRLAARAFARADVLLCPTLNILPPAPGELSSSRGTVDAFFDVEFAATGATAVANVTGWPAITLPLGQVDELPVGVQLMALDEAVLIRVASQLEEALPWAERRPPDYA
ncbi:MAG TPA: amidase [Solirubrobacteraceae bacterium]|nr:amidase [Solirubrobacteraceae bacterium]